MYCSFFGFTEHPFNVTPDPRFLFMTDSHREAYASMAYGIAERKGFVCLMGEVGTGKTTLIRRLLEDLRQKKVHYVYICQAVWTIEEILRQILQELDIPSPGRDKLSLIRRLNDFLLESLAREENLALLIDEAHNLSSHMLEELRLLSNLETDTAKLLQIVLVGQPELGVKLNFTGLRQLRQRIPITRILKPLDAKQSKEYIAHRVTVAGGKISRVFRSQAVDLISEYARGIPRVINMLCDNALLIAYGMNKKKIGVRIAKKATQDIGVMPAVGDMHPAAPLLSGNGHNGEAVVLRRRADLRRSDSPWRFSGYKILVLLAGIIACLLLVFFLDRGYLKGGPENKGAALIGIQPSNLAVDGNKAGSSVESTGSIASAATVDEAQSKPTGSAKPGRLRQEPAAPKNKEVAEVGQGKTSSKLAQKNHEISAPLLIDRILESNPKLANMKLVGVGQKIALSEIGEDSMIHAGPDGTFKAHLATVSQMIYAEPLRNNPALKGKLIEFIPRKVSPQETWYEVYAGPFSDKEECLRIMDVLKREFW